MDLMTLGRMFKHRDVAELKFVAHVHYKEGLHIIALIHV